MFKLPGSDCRKRDDKGISKLACNGTKACSHRSSHSWLMLPLLLNSGFPWIHALLTCQKVLWLEPLFLLKELGTDRGRFYSVPGCGDTNSDTSSLQLIWDCDWCSSVSLQATLSLWQQEKGSADDRDNCVVPRITFPLSSRTNEASKDSKRSNSHNWSWG